MTRNEDSPSRLGWLRRARRPLGILTRGKTTSGRLRRADQLLAVAYPFTLRNMRAPFIDLGYGETPVTALESLQQLRAINPSLRVIGVEIDADRVQAAQRYARPGLEFRLGGFNLPLAADEVAGVIRALNVLRQYPEADYAASLAVLGSYLAQSGILLEGTSDPPGNLMAVSVYLRGGVHLIHDGLALMANLRRPFAPRDLQAILPKNYIHHVEPGSPLDEFFGAWSAAWLRAIQTQERDPRWVFAQAGIWLREEHGYPVSLRPGLLRRGILLLRSVPGDVDSRILLTGRR
jgi:hypothetical protein